MSQQEDQPRVKRSRFDTSGDVSGAPAAPAPKPAIPTSEGAKAALEKARRTLETKKKLAETLAKLRDKKVCAVHPVLHPCLSLIRPRALGHQACCAPATCKKICCIHMDVGGKQGLIYHLVCPLQQLPVAPGGAAALPQPVPAPAFAPPPGAAAAQQPGAKPKTQMPAPLRLDEQGREVDEFGRPIERDLSRVAAPTLKVNISQLMPCMRMHCACTLCDDSEVYCRSACKYARNVRAWSLRGQPYANPCLRQLPPGLRS